MSISIGSPARFGRTGEPDRSIIRRVPPRPVVVEILITHGIFGNVTARRGVIRALIALFRPLLQIVWIADAFNIGGELVCPGECPGFVSMHSIGLAAAG